ncbi:Uncharacterised protein [Kingella potus]|uniref:SH3 domain-containing protein n=1 Tax=Kingella potus TaxID=265175 RepID=A0A377R248_9NEIS|nr:Uncharacterised protein [Kingella potus]
MPTIRAGGVFPTFAKGSAVENLAPCPQYPNWFACRIAGRDTYVPACFVADGRLLCDYNPTELRVSKGDKVMLAAVCYQWALVGKDGETGWLPFEILSGGLDGFHAGGSA